jgi:Gamma-glutamyltranspeptidase
MLSKELFSKEQVPLLADEEHDLPLTQPPPRRVKQEEPTETIDFQGILWDVRFWGTLLVAPIFVIIFGIFLVVQTRHSPIIGYGISIRKPPPTLPGWPAKRNPAYLIHAKHGAVATENILCSNIGVDVLKDGGNAVDASIAATLCIGVVNMFRYRLIYYPANSQCKPL